MSVVEQRKATAKTNRRGESWDETYERIQREIPSTKDGSWAFLISEEGLFRLIGDIGNVGNTVRRRGHRTPPSPDLVAETIDTVFRKGLGVGQGPHLEREYTGLAFLDAFRIMVGRRSLTQISRRCHIQRDRVHRLLTGRYKPTGLEMESIAQGFGKDPYYFREYRSVAIAARILARLDEDPDLSAAIARTEAS